MTPSKKKIIVARLDKLIPEAIAFLQKYEPARGYFVAFSGGKDSITIEKLCRLSGVKYITGYSRTGIDPPEVVGFIKRHYPDTLVLKPKTDFYTLIRKKGPPLNHRRWCCEHLKEKAGIEFKEQFPIHVTGIRAEESNKRALRPIIDVHPSIKSVNIKPIFHWLEYHVWEFIERYSLPYPSIYDTDFNRVGCAVCPSLFAVNQINLERHQTRWPGIHRAFKSAVKDWWQTKDDEMHKNFEDYYDHYLRGFYDKKEKVSVKETQLDIFSRNQKSG